LQIEVEETPSNVAFVVDGVAVTECPKCETPLKYEEVMGKESSRFQVLGSRKGFE
jgi:hypothetical protein